MALAGNAVMLNWSDVRVENRDDYYDWHNHEHIAGRVALPGFQRGRRSIAVDADRDFFNLYEVDNLSVFTGPEYSALANNPSEATRRTGKIIINAVRGLARVRCSLGIGQGGFLLSLRFDVAPGAEQRLERHLIDAVLPGIDRIPNIVGVHFCITDQPASTVITGDRIGRPTEVPKWIIILEGVSREILETTYASHLTDAALKEHGAVGPFVRGIHRTEIVVAKLPSWRSEK